MGEHLAALRVRIIQPAGPAKCAFRAREDGHVWRGLALRWHEAHSCARVHDVGRAADVLKQAGIGDRALQIFERPTAV
jgi:hypothetical protein